MHLLNFFPNRHLKPRKVLVIRWNIQRSNNEKFFLLIFFPRHNSFWAASVQMRSLPEPCLGYRKVNTTNIWKCFRERLSPGTIHKKMFCSLKCELMGALVLSMEVPENGQLHSQPLVRSCFNASHTGRMGFGETAPPWETALGLIQDARGLSYKMSPHPAMEVTLAGVIQEMPPMAISHRRLSGGNRGPGTSSTWGWSGWGTLPVSFLQNSAPFLWRTLAWSFPGAVAPTAVLGLPSNHRAKMEAGVQLAPAWSSVAWDWARTRLKRLQPSPPAGSPASRNAMTRSTEKM